MCSMIYDQPHHQQLDMTMMASSNDKTSPSFGVGIGQTSVVRQPSVGLVVPVNTGKENGGTSCLGVPAGNIPASAPGVGVESIIDDGELRLEVTCGQNQALLYTGRLQLGSKGTCVLFENAWLTPNEFQYVSGRETAKDWKRSIKHHGKSLKVLIAKGILTTSPPARCDCGQCNSSPRKPNSGSDCAVFTAPSVDCVKQNASDCSEAWRSGVHSASTTDCTSATAGSAFRPPPEVASSTGAYRNSDCALTGDLSTVNDDAFGSRSMSTHLKSTHHQQSAGEQTHGGSITSSSSSPDSRSKKSSSSGASKRPRSPSADSSLEHPPSKHQLLDGTGHHGSESSNGRGEHQSRLGYESSSSRSHQRQQFSPSADGGSQRRRDQSQSSTSSNGQCRSSQSGGFKSPSIPAHHHYQNGSSGSQQQTSSSQKSSPATGITASTGADRSHVGLSADPSCVISPLAATPYFPFLAAAAAATSTAAQLPTTPVCYPNPYMMLPLAAAAAAYQNPSAAQFPSPYGWNSAAASVASSVADASRLSSGNISVASSGPAFDFPWMRGGGCGGPTATNSAYSSKLSPTPPSMIGDPYELAKQSSTFGLGSAAQNPYAYRGGSSSAAAAAAAGFGGLFAAAADGLDAYENYMRSSFKVATPHLTSAAAAAAAGFQQSLFDGQHNAAAAAAGFGVYPPLFQSPYFGIPSR